MTLWSTSIALIICILVTRQNIYVKTTNEVDQSQSSEISQGTNDSSNNQTSSDDNSQSPTDETVDVTDSQQDDQDQSGTDIETPGSPEEPGDQDVTEDSGTLPEQEDQLDATDSTQALDTSQSVYEAPPQPQTEVAAPKISPTELDIGISKSNKKINRTDSGGVSTFFPKDQNVFSKIKERVGASCCKSDIIIWEAPSDSEYCHKVELDLARPDKKVLKVHLCNDETKIFVKSTSGSNNQWEEESIESHISPLSKFEIKTLDDFHNLLTIITYNENLEYDENDTSKYDVERTNEEIYYKFKSHSKCVQLKLGNENLWKYDPQKDPLYPKSITFNMKHMGITLRMMDDYLTCFSFGTDFKLNYSGIVKPIVFEKNKKSTDQWYYAQNGYEGIYVTKDHYAYNKVDLLSDITKTLDHLLWYPEFETEYAFKVIVDGVGPFKKNKNVTVFQLNGDIKHFKDIGNCKKNWIQTSSLITLDIKSTKSTKKFTYQGNNKFCTFTSKLNFQFASVKKGNSIIWTCPSVHQTSSKVDVENLDKPEIHVTIHLPDNLKKVYIMSEGEWVEDLLLILDVRYVRENQDYAVIKSNGNKIVTCKSTNRFMKIIETKNSCNCFGEDKVIWAPELTQHYSHKVILDGASYFESTKNLIVYQLDGSIKHFTKTGSCSKFWVQKPLSITLDISLKKSTREFVFELDGTKLIYTRTYNFEFTKIVNKKETVWDPSPGIFCTKVVVENYSKPDVKVTLQISDVVTLDYVISNNQWVQKGSISLDILQAKGQDYEIQDAGSGAKLFTPNEGHQFDHIRSGSQEIWSSDDSSVSKKVILKGNENSEQLLAVFLDNGIRVFQKAGKGQNWYDITFSRYSLSHFKLFTKDDTGFQILIPKDQYEMESAGFTVGYKFTTDVKCYQIRYIDDVIWDSGKKYPEGIRINMDENKIFIIFDGKPEELTLKVKKPKILDITKKQKTAEYNYVLEGEFGVFTSSEDCIFNGLWADCQGKKEIWYPEKEEEYSNKIKVNKSGNNPDHAMVYLKNGDIKHFTRGSKDEWSEIPTKITLDITKKSTTIQYTYHSTGNSCTFTAKHNFLFVKLVEETLPIWKSPYSIQISNKVEVKNMGSPDVQVTIHLPDEFKLVFVKNYGEWMELGLLILDIDSRVETVDYNYSLDNNITTYSPKSQKKFMKIISKKGEIVWKSKDRDNVSIKVIMRVTKESGEMMAIVFDFSFMLLYKQNKDWSDITETRYSLEKLKMFRYKPEINRKFEFKTTHYHSECIRFSCGFKFEDKVNCIEIQYDGNRIWTHDLNSPYPKGIYLNLNLNYFFLLYADGSIHNLTRAITEQIEIDIRCEAGTPQYEYVKDENTVTSTYEAIGGVAFNKIKEKRGREEYRDVWNPDKENEFVYKILLYGEKMKSLNHIALYFVGGVIEHYKRVGWRKKSWVRKDNFLEVDISKKVTTLEYHALDDKTNGIVTYTPKFNFKFKTVKSGDKGIWYQDQLLYSDIVITKGNKQSDQHLFVILINDSHKFYHKPAGGEWLDKTGERKSLIHIKMFKRGDSGDLIQLKRPSYQLTTTGSSLGYSFSKDVVCDVIQHKGKNIWERKRNDKSPKGINLQLLENNFVLAFESSYLKLDVT